MIFKLQKKQGGMTYVELIVVLSIFSIVTGTVIFNYKSFQEKVDLRNLANDIALKFVEAQKNSTGGKIPFGKIIPTSPPLPAEWKPSYGIYLNPNSTVNTGNKTFYYFTDLNQNKMFGENYNCPIGECIEKFTLTKDIILNDMYIHYYTGSPESVDTGISLTFTRPDSVMTIQKSGATSPLLGVDYLEFRVEGTTYVTIRVYSSGRVEMI